MSDSETFPSVEELRRKIQEQLKQSGMESVIKKMVQNICASKSDPASANPEEVLEEIYTKGLLKPMLGLADETSNVFIGNCSRKLNTGKHWMEKLGEREKTDLEKAKRFYLKFEILGGKAFLDHLLHGDAPCKTRTLVLHVTFKSQRFKSQAVECHVDPNFRDEFLIDIAQFRGSVTGLMEVKEPLMIFIIREDTNLSVTSGGTVISFTMHDWRTILLTSNGSESCNLELYGIGLENNTPVGFINVKTSLLPCPEEQISDSSFLSYMQSEKREGEGNSRFCVSYAKLWMNEFLSIRPGHVLRGVELFAFDIKMVSRPLVTFVNPPLNVDRVFKTPFEVAWVVSLLSHSTNSKQTPVPVLQNLECTIAAKSGSDEDLAILLCSLLMGFGLDAFVVCGFDQRASSSKTCVLTHDATSLPIFWDPVSGKRFKFPSPSPDSESINLANTTNISKSQFSRFHLSYIFNSQKFYANIQTVDSPMNVDWNLENPTKWKSIPSKIIEKLRTSNTQVQMVLFPSTRDYELLTAEMEIQIQELIAEQRMLNQLPTKWDISTSKLLGQQLATYELQSSTGGSNFENFFDAVIMKSIPEGYDFKAYHHCSNSTNLNNLFYHCLREPTCQEIISCRGEDVQMAVRLMIFPYAENILSVRLMIACKFMSIP